MPGRRPLLSLIVALGAALAVAIAGAVLAFTAPIIAADAQDVPGAITSLRFVAPDPANPSAPLTAGQQFRMDATWSVPDTAQPGDTFSLVFPSPITGNSSTFVMNDPSGNDVGTCVVVSNNVTCTLSDYVLTHSGVQGTLYFFATVSGGYDRLIFSTSWGGTFELDVPPYDPNPGPTPDPTPGPVPPPTAISKTVGHTTDGQRWVVQVPGSQLRFNGSDVVLTDTYDAHLRIDLSTLTVQRVPTSLYGTSTAPVALHEGAGPDTYTLVRDAGPNSFQLTINDAMADQVYSLWYSSTVAPGTADGTVLTNTIVGVGQSSAQTIYSGAGGDGGGEQGRLTVAKAVAGGGEAPAESFPMSVTCVRNGATVDGFPREAQIAAGASVTFDAIPLGSECTVTETDSKGADSVAYSQRTVTVASATVPVVVTVTNTYEAARTGALAITKRVDGDGVAPTGAFPMSVTCGEEDALLPGFPQVLEILAGRTATIEDIPIGAQCRITETDSKGANRVAYSAPLVTITDATTPIEVTVTNTYLAPRGALIVTKKVAGDGTAPSGTFPIEVECTHGSTAVAGFPYEAEIAARKSVELDAIPVGATCTITETDSRGASSVRYSQQTVTIADATTPVEVTVTNTYTAPPPGLALTGRGVGWGLGVLGTAQAAFLFGAILLLSARRRRRA